MSGRGHPSGIVTSRCQTWKPKKHEAEENKYGVQTTEQQHKALLKYCGAQLDTVLAGGSVEMGGESAEVTTPPPNLHHEDTPTDLWLFEGLHRHWGTEITGNSIAICLIHVDTVLWYMAFMLHALEIYNHFNRHSTTQADNVPTFLAFTDFLL